MRLMGAPTSSPKCKDCSNKERHKSNYGRARSIDPLYLNSLNVNKGIPNSRKTGRGGLFERVQGQASL